MQPTTTTSIPTVGLNPRPQPYRGSREQILALSTSELSDLIQANAGYLQRRRRRTDDLIEALFPDTCLEWCAGDPFNDLELALLLNQALSEAGYIPVERIFHEEVRHLLGDIFRWEFCPNWGCR
jgi:hypothetical protein